VEAVTYATGFGILLGVALLGFGIARALRSS